VENLGGVIISGAGPVGLVAALGLARAGVKVTLVDAASTINNSPRAAIYYPTTLDVLERYGLLEDALEAGYKSTEYHFRAPAKDTLIKLDFSVLEGAVRYPYNLHLGQDVLAHLVLRHLLRYPHAEVRWNTNLVGFEQDQCGVTVKVETADGPKELRADWLIGSDGARSTVRRLLDLPFEGHTWPDRFVATNVRFDFEKYGFAPINMVSDPVNWAVIARLGKENLWRCTFGEDPELPEDEVLRRIPERYAAILPGADRYEIVAASPYRVHERCVPKLRVGRVLLAGDAAHVCNPCGGMGLTTGIIDAVEVSDALNAVISKQTDDTILDYYSAERRRVFLECTTPTASNIKRILSEKDPQKHLEDEEAYRLASNNVEIGRKAMMFPAGVIGRPFPQEKFSTAGTTAQASSSNHLAEIR
jgi:2-polyprenyl-6-methoxyphenol hydroxylase-like FAD-dependent oxidoreductase